MNHSAEKAPVEKTKSNAAWKTQFYVLCGMLVLALVGMGLTQAKTNGAWEYWLFVVVVYAALGLWRSIGKAKQAGQSVRQLVGRELGHWITLLAFLGVLLLLERREIINRDSASYVALMLLGLSCCLAGVHFDWMLLIVGVVLSVMTISLATLEQYTVMVWVIMILVVVAAGAFYFFKSKSRGSAAESFD